MSLFLNLLLMSKKTWPLKKKFLREVSKLLKCYVLVKKFYRKSATSLKTLQCVFLTKSKFWRAAVVPQSFLFGYQNLLFRLFHNHCAFLYFCYKMYAFFRNSSLYQRRHYEYIAGLQDPFKYMNGKRKKTIFIYIINFFLINFG